MMRKRILAGCGAVLLLVPAIAQVGGGPNGGTSGPGANGSSVSSGTQMGRGNISAEDFNKLQDSADMARRMTKSSKTLEELLKEDKDTAIAIAAALPLSCQVDKAVLAAEGPETINGKKVSTQTYEAVCTNGLGYFLTKRDGGLPSGMSCVAAHAAQTADLAAGRKPGLICRQPETADIKTMMTNVLTRAGTACTVRDIRWVGDNSTVHVEFDEVACTDNRGFIVTTALPGATSSVRVMTCKDAALRGLPCTLTDSGGDIATPQAFRQAIKQRGIACDAEDKDVRLIGQENVQKRFVVEFKCTKLPQGLVSFIPLGESKAPFEALDCATAAKRGVKCTLTPAKP